MTEGRRNCHKKQEILSSIEHATVKFRFRMFHWIQHKQDSAAGFNTINITSMQLNASFSYLWFFVAVHILWTYAKPKLSQLGRIQKACTEHCKCCKLKVEHACMFQFVVSSLCCTLNIYSTYLHNQFISNRHVQKSQAS